MPTKHVHFEEAPEMSLRDFLENIETIDVDSETELSEIYATLR